ncbi:MAG: tRNA uridine-5-carboxymethylaminomethyl(34) synthesis enzyme MnmG [Phycisphaeraceae bacterium]|nr:tRNA uridine-5-carboxymethylaminomethyl(34) synthesis enzyme MnmG [Phycisphaeraceae bacterium]
MNDTTEQHFDVLVVGGGHAGAEAAWAACNLGCRVGLVTLDAGKIGAMSCNPAIGGLAKGQMVREIDAMGGLMGLAADATGIQFRVLNASKGQAVRGPRCQSDKYRYAREVQRLLSLRLNLTIIEGGVERLIVERGRVAGVWISPHARPPRHRTGATCSSADPHSGRDPSPADDSPYDRLINQAHRPTEPVCLRAKAIVLTTGTFMRGLMHTGQARTPGGRVGELPALGISASLAEFGLELGRLKTGTPPRLDGRTIDFSRLDIQPGDDHPVPFSEMSDPGLPVDDERYALLAMRFPVLEQRPCHITSTCRAAHDLIRANLDRAPLFNGQIERHSVGPRYCPSIEDKVVRFPDRHSHHVYLEPESLETDEVYCNGISTSLPADIQDVIVAKLPGCGNARILRYGYAVEYDMVWPHQIDATTMTKSVDGLFLAGQINGTSGYEEAAAQGLLAGLNAARYGRGEELIRLGRDEAYLGVLMDDLVTCRPREPYRMFTSRAEFRLQLRADNAAHRLTARARRWGLIDDTRWRIFSERRRMEGDIRATLAGQRYQGISLMDWLKRPEVDVHWLMQRLDESAGSSRLKHAADSAAALDIHRRPLRSILDSIVSHEKYSGYLHRQERDVARLRKHENTPIASDFNYRGVGGLRSEAVEVLSHFRPATVGQASRLAGVTPADVLLLLIKVGRLNPSSPASETDATCPV